MVTTYESGLESAADWRARPMPRAPDRSTPARRRSPATRRPIVAVILFILSAVGIALGTINLVSLGLAGVRRLLPRRAQLAALVTAMPARQGLPLRRT